MSNRATLVIFCKTYAGDSANFKSMLASYNTFNCDNIPLYVSVPKEDVDEFKAICEDKAIVISDESYARGYLSEEGLWGMTGGYINQEICKLSFWEAGYAENYLCVDSDAYFIRKFYVDDFMANKSTPYTVLTMDKDLHVQPWYRDFSDWRKEKIEAIFKAVGLNDRRLLTCHGMTVLNAEVLRDLKESFMRRRNYSYRELIAISPYEFTWYNAWLQKSKKIDIFATEPFFKTFHTREEYRSYRLNLITVDNLATQYVGIVLNSNWRRKKEPFKYEYPGGFITLLNKILKRIIV